MARLKTRFLLAATLGLPGRPISRPGRPGRRGGSRGRVGGRTHCIAYVANYAKDIEYAPGCTDPNPAAPFSQALLEVQFYPDAVVQDCAPDGGFAWCRPPTSTRCAPGLAGGAAARRQPFDALEALPCTSAAISLAEVMAHAAVPAGAGHGSARRG
jgi:hypothetical protein